MQATVMIAVIKACPTAKARPRANFGAEAFNPGRVNAPLYVVDLIACEKNINQPEDPRGRVEVSRDDVV